MRGHNRVRRVLASLMLFTMVSSVVVDSNLVTALAVDNTINTSESEIVVEKEDHQNDSLTETNTESNQEKTPEDPEEKNNNDIAEGSQDDSPSKADTESNQEKVPEKTPENSEEKNNNDIEEGSQDDSPSETIADPNQEKIPEILEEKKEPEEKDNSKENKEKDTNSDSEEKADESKAFDKELTVDGYKVDIKAAEGVFPDGTKVEIKTVDTIGKKKAENVISEEMEEIDPDAEIVKTVTFDINFYSKEGKIIEPENGSVNITITPDLQETSELKKIEKELGKTLECSVFHVDDKLNVEEVECETKKDYTEVSFDAESFSSYVVTWYADPDPTTGNQETSLEGPKYIDGFEKIITTGFSRFSIPISWTNDNGETELRPTDLEFTIYGTDTTGSSKQRIKICDVKVTLTEEEKKASNITINLADEVQIPVYVQRGTGETKNKGNGTYIMDGFEYEVKFHDENTAYQSQNNGFAAVKTDRETNEAIWYADAGTITNRRKDLASASYKIEWYDNNNANHKRPYSTGNDAADKEAINSKVELYYCTNNDSTLKPVTKDMMPAGEAATGPNISKDSYSTWSISYKNLLPFDENGNEIIYKLKLADDFANGYKSDSETNDCINKGETRKYSLLGEFKAKIRWNDGGRDNELRPEIADKFEVFTINGDQTTPVEVAPEDIKITKNGNTWEFEVDKLVMYSAEGDGAVKYYVTLEDSIKDKDYTDYRISYTNAPNHTDVTKCHDGGTIFLTLKRNLDSFAINKKWVDGYNDSDENKEDRNNLIDSDVILYLWRYPVKKVVGEKVVAGTIADGAPVNNAQGVQYFYKLKDTDNKNFDLHFTDFVGENGTLDMYDTQGYEYVYYVTEIMGGNEYVTSYSNVNPYEHIETAVANGGTLINLRKESIKIEGIVRWRVPSVTDYTKATATICLQKKENEEWKTVGDPVIVAGFTEADPQKKHVFPAVDKYDDEGKEITYRVIETNINYNGKDIEVTNYLPVEGKENYYASEYKMPNDDTGYNYTVTAHPTYDEPGKYSFTVDNRMSGDVKLDITKVWKDKAAYGGIEASEGKEGHYSNISIGINQKNYLGETKPYGTVKVENVDPDTGVISGNKATLTIKATGETKDVLITVVPDTDPNLTWSFAGIELPEFDENGRAYTYSIKETNIAGTSGIPNTHTDYAYSFDGKDIRATVTNTYVESGGDDHFYFEIDKEWIDGADLSQRQPVTVAIVNVDKDGNYKYEDNEGKKHEYVLSAENNWHQDVWLSKYYGEGENKKERFNKKDTSESESEQWLWTVIEKDVSLKAEYEKLSDIDLSADDNMHVIHRNVEYPNETFDLSATSINGIVDAIAHNDIHKPGYDVEIVAVGQDSSVFGASKYRVTNRRAGEVNVEFDKKWHDSENKADTRGDALRVKLYQNDKLVVKGDETSTEQLAYINSITTTIDGTETNDADKTNPAEIKYTYDSTNGSGDSNKIEFNHLPKYDEHGVEYEYSVREFMVRKDEAGNEEEIEILTYDTEDTTLSGYIADIEGHGESVTFSKDASNPEKLIRNELYKYNNTLTGKLTTGVPFYVIWHDQSSYEDGGRPDMYFTLYYRTIGSEDAPKKFEGDYKVLWNAVEENGNSNPYYRYAEFIGLPIADENGNAYEFFASASLNNAADHYYEYYYETHDDAELNSNVIAKETPLIHHYDIPETASKSELKGIDGVKLIPAGGLVEYIIHEEITPKGKKFWEKVDQGIAAADLPNVDVYLGRYSDHDTDTNKMYEGTLTDVNFDKAITYTALDNDKLSFDFGTNENPDAPKSFAKYDSYGQIYTYQLAEKIYVNSTEAKKYQVPNYIMKYDPNSLNLVNTYLNGEDTPESSRSITVNKKWEDKDGHDLSLTEKYPEARFKLYCMEIDPKDCVSIEGNTDIPYNPKPAKYAEVIKNFNTLKSNGNFKECGEEKKIKYNNDSQPASWTNMPIYAPSGRPYLYVVEETSGHGMDAYAITNDAKTSSEGNTWISNTQVLISNSGLSPAGTYNDETNKKNVGFTNTLKNGSTISKITGEKAWSDNATLFTDVRPNTVDCNTYAEGSTNKPVELKLERTARTQTGVNNAITESLVEGKDYKVIWKVKTGSPNVWVYEIIPINETGELSTSEFQVYAPNGQPYTYYVTEKLYGVADTNYKATVSKVSRSATATSNKILTETTSLSNTLKGQVQLFKKWDDALNEHNLRSGFVHVILQYREVPKEDSSENTAGDNGTVEWKTYKQQKADGIYELTYAGNKWKVNVPNLPIKNSDGTKVYEYRVLEVNFNDHEEAPLIPIIYDQKNDKVYYKPTKGAEPIDVPNGGESYKNSNRFEGTGHFETKVDNYIVNHSVIENLIKENSRMLQVDNFLSEKAALIIEKKWDGIEGADNYEVLPDNIVFKVQYSTDKNYTGTWIDLKADGKSVTATVSKEGGWKQAVDNLPLNTSGQLTYYRAVELATNLGRFEGYNKIEGSEMSEKSDHPGVEYEHDGEYDSEIHRVDCSTTATNTLATRELSVKKKWNDDDAHGDVDIELWSYNYNTDAEPFAKVPGTEATLKSSEGYEFTYHNLPLNNKNGNPVVYYVKEVNVDGAAYNATKYDTAFFVSYDNSTYESISANTDASNIAKIVDNSENIANAVCIVNTPKATLNVTKKWEDENNRHKLRNEVSFGLTDNNGGEWTSITVKTEDNIKKYTFTELPMYKTPDKNFVEDTTKKNMGKVEYTVKEDNSSISGYKAPVYTVNGEIKTEAKLTLDKVPSTTANNVLVLNEYIPPKATITADKLWDDENKRHGSRPSHVELSLYYRVGTSGDWNLITKKQLEENKNYSDGGVYTTSEVTQIISENQKDSGDSNKWIHNDTIAKWDNLPTVKDGAPIYYKVLETSGVAKATVPAKYTGNFSGYEVTYLDENKVINDNGSTFTSDNEKKNQLVKNTLKRTQILVEKQWEDTAEQNMRPISVTFELQYKHANKPWIPYTNENGEVKNIVVTGNSGVKKWTEVVSDLPFADSEGHEYVYRLKEVSMKIKTSSGEKVVYDRANDNFSETTWNGEIGAYDNRVTVAKSTDSRYNYKITAVNTPEVGNVTVTKVWDDNNNRDGLRPDSIDVTLYRDGKKYAEAEIGPNLFGTTVTADADGNKNKWTYTWDNLPIYKDDAEYHDDNHKSAYYVIEDEDSISKNEINEVLNYKNPTYGLFEYSINDIAASAVQTHVSSKDDTETDLWIKNTHDPIRFKINAYKKWDDNNNAHDERPSSVDLLLQYRIHGSKSESDWVNVTGNISVDNLDKTGKIVQSTSVSRQTVSYPSDEVEGYPDIWTIPAVWENLPAYVIGSDGKPKLVEYRVKEVWTEDIEEHYEAELPNFYYDIEEAKLDSTYPNDDLIVENISDYNSTITVIKEWDQKELLVKYGALPTELYVKLQEWKDNKWEDCDESLNPSAVLKEHEEFENSWTHTYQGLTQGHEYRVVEEKIVFADGSEVSSVINNKDKNDKGNGQIGNFDIRASVVELASHEEGGEAKSKHWVAELKNSIPNRKLEVTKKWNDENNRDELRPTHIYVTLKRDDNKPETVILDEANNWKHEWDYLPLYKNETKEDNSPILSEYSLFETDAHGNPVPLEQYTVTYDITKPSKEPESIDEEGFNLDGVADKEAAEILVTNTHEPAKTKVYASKKWDDADDPFGERVDTIYLALFYKYQHESDDEWRLIDKAKETDFDSDGLYKDSLILTTSAPVQKVEKPSGGNEWNDIANWENLSSQAVVDENGKKVIRKPEYRVVEVKNDNITSGTKLSAVLEDDTKVISGYDTIQPDAFFVYGGDSKDHKVVNKLDPVSVNIIKKWEDQSNRFANRPISVNFAIQKKKVDVEDSSWEPLKENNETKMVSVDSEMHDQGDPNTWKLAVHGLPKYDAKGDELIYRAVEVSLVYADKTIVHVFDANDSSDPLKTEFGNGKNGYKTVEEINPPIVHEGNDITEYPTTITNTQDSSVKVTAKKVWKDSNNSKKKRPLSVIFEIEKRQVHNATVSGIIATISDFFKQKGGWTPVYELNDEGEKEVATITLEGPEFGEVSFDGLPLYDENGNELVYRAREIKLVYKNKTIGISSGANPYQAPKYSDQAEILESADNGITHSYTTEATNRIKPDPPADEPGSGDDPETPPDTPSGPSGPSGPVIPPVTPPVTPPKDPVKPVLPPELEDIDDEIDTITDPEDITPIVEELIDLPDGPEKEEVVKKLWVIVSTLANDPTFYDHFDPEMQDILKRFVRTGVLGRRRSTLPKTSGLKGSFLIMLIGFILIGIGIGFTKKKTKKQQ